MLSPGLMVMSCELERSLLVVAEYSRQLHGLAIAHLHAQMMMRTVAGSKQNGTRMTLMRRSEADLP